MKKYRVRLWNGMILWKTNDYEELDELVDKLKAAKIEYFVEVLSDEA